MREPKCTNVVDQFYLHYFDYFVGLLVVNKCCKCCSFDVCLFGTVCSDFHLYLITDLTVHCIAIYNKNYNLQNANSN